MNKLDKTPIEPIVLQVGAAVQDSQRLELLISLIITMLVDLSEGRLSGDDFVGWMDKLGSETLGKLIKTIQKWVDFDEASQKKLEDALKSRNFIVHHFFNDRSELFLTSEGRSRVLLELDKNRKLIRHADAMLVPVVAKLFELNGMEMSQVMLEIHAKYESD